MLGWPEILLILGVMLPIFGPSKLPEMARSLGQAFREFQNATATFEKEAKAMTDTLPDLNALPTALMPQPNILRKPIAAQPAAQPAALQASIPATASAKAPEPAEAQPAQPQAAATDAGGSNIAEVAKMLGISTEGRTEEDLKIAIHDKIDGLDQKEV